VFVFVLDGFFLGHCLALYVCCVLDKENSKDSFIQCVVVFVGHKLLCHND
jgi:hypothetical protein